MSGVTRDGGGGERKKFGARGRACAKVEGGSDTCEGLRGELGLQHAGEPEALVRRV